VHWIRIEGARGIWGNRTTGWGINIQLGGSIQRVGDQYRPWGINQKIWEINYFFHIFSLVWNLQITNHITRVHVSLAYRRRQDYKTCIVHGQVGRCTPCARCTCRSQVGMLVTQPISSEIYPVHKTQLSVPSNI